ncbi:DNA endonuclease SmrA [Aeromonas bivalvium]|uniref:DNA endonuclease SmrA n=1 Tax=Aeromonas bivalvium TaxID=440079 RepID=UPI0038CF985D
MSDNDERSLFLQEVADVKPIRHDRISPQPGTTGASEAQLARRHAAAHGTSDELDLLSLDPAPALDPHAIVGFKRDGVQEGVYKKLRLGKYVLQGSLDLRRHSVPEARRALVDFLRDCERRDIRCLLILHGRGEGPAQSAPSLEGAKRGRLKSQISAWLPCLPSVMAAHSAQPHHGGSGALYVLLRKSEQKKAQNRERHQQRLG